VFKSGGLEGFRITPAKEMKIPGQVYMDLHKPSAGLDDRILTIDYTGKVQSLEKTGLIEVMYSLDCFVDDNGNTITPTPSPLWNSDPGILWTGGNCVTASVGINTNTPIANLDVRGTAYVSGTTSLGGIENSSTPSKLYVKQTAPNRNALTIDFTSTSTTTSGIGINTIVDSDNRKAFVVYNNAYSKDVFRVMGDGQVWATQVHVRIKEDFPDYVFSDSYDLMSINDLETYIEENNHLPNIPTAEEVAKEGVELGEINRILVEKIEEMSLYIIMLQKEIELLKLKQK